jgi:hypothetical protein
MLTFHLLIKTQLLNQGIAADAQTAADPDHGACRQIPGDELSGRAGGWQAEEIGYVLRREQWTARG